MKGIARNDVLTTASNFLNKSMKGTARNELITASNFLNKSIKGASRNNE